MYLVYSINLKSKMLLIIETRYIFMSPRELSSVGRNVALYMQRVGFEPRSSYLFILRMKFLSDRLLNRKKSIYS
jgi:hypothetical protein